MTVDETAHTWVCFLLKTASMLSVKHGGNPKNDCIQCHISKDSKYKNKTWTDIIYWLSSILNQENDLFDANILQVHDMNQHSKVPYYSSCHNVTEDNIFKRIFCCLFSLKLALL